MKFAMLMRVEMALSAMLPNVSYAPGAFCVTRLTIEFCIAAEDIEPQFRYADAKVFGPNSIEVAQISHRNV